MQRMSDKRFRVGVTVSIGWIFVLLAVLWFTRVKLPGMGPNEWGDYLAGMFAPLALLWLILGYMQQGEELKLNTEALRLQAEELRNSVEQQRQLVEVSRLQVESEREALAYERELRERENQPQFTVSGGGGAFRGDGQCDYAVIVTNTGPLSTQFVIDIIDPMGNSKRLYEAPLFARGVRANSRYKVDAPLMGDGIRLCIHGVDALSRDFELQCPVFRKDNHPHTGLSFGSFVEIK